MLCCDFSRGSQGDERWSEPSTSWVRNIECPDWSAARWLRSKARWLQVLPMRAAWFDSETSPRRPCIEGSTEAADICWRSE
eukprot:964133-Rhodomonas_salina.1